MIFDVPNFAQFWEPEFKVVLIVLSWHKRTKVGIWFLNTPNVPNFAQFCPILGTKNGTLGEIQVGRGLGPEGLALLRGLLILR